MIGVGTTIFLVRPEVFPSGTTYLLDTYSAAAAYSLRQLKTGVTSVVRVRRSSDSAESDFTATEITDGTLVAWTGANDGHIVTLYDQSGGSKGNFYNTAAGQQPKLVNAGTVYTDTNGLPYIVFDGIDDDLRRETLISASASDLWMFHVTHSTDTFITKDAGVATWGLQIANQSSSPVYDRAAVVTISPATFYGSAAVSETTGQKLLTLQYKKGTTIRAYTNGTGATAATPANTDLRTTTGLVEIGRAGDNIAKSMQFQEFILFETDESANQTAIETEISTHYSL